MTFCPYCGVRQDIDLRQIHFRDMGTDASQPCPSCETPLSVIEFDTTPPMRVERCGACNGMFFNPGELEALLDHQTNPLVWLDNVQLQQISSDFGFQHEVVYRKCPLCAERMGHVNFGGRSGVVLDRCGTHGVWVEGGELRRLTEWWRAGGKLIFSIFGALAEFERNLIRERTSAGLAAARARGRVGGRPPKMTTKKIKQAKLMRDNGMSQTEIAEILGVGRTTLYRHLK